MPIKTFETSSGDANSEENKTTIDKSDSSSSQSLELSISNSYSNTIFNRKSLSKFVEGYFNIYDQGYCSVGISFNLFSKINAYVTKQW